MNKTFKIIVIALILIISMGISTSCSKSSEKNTQSSTNSEKSNESDMDETKDKEQESVNPEDYNTGITYEQLARNPDKYEGEKATFSGEVLQVMEEEDMTMIRLAVDGNYDTVMMLGIPKSLKLESRILEKDYITVRGTSKGIITYESSFSGNITVPALAVEGVGELENLDTDNSKEEIKKENSEEVKKESTSNDSSSSKKSEYTRKLEKVNNQVNDMSVSGSTAQMEDALAEQYSKWDDLLNDIYGALKNQLSSEDMASLKKEQRAWIKTRDNKAEEASSGGGTKARLEYTSSLMETTKDRCYELVEDYMK